MRWVCRGVSHWIIRQAPNKNPKVPAWCILGDERTLSMAQCIPLDHPLPRPPIKTLKSWHGVSWGDARTLSMAQCIPLNDRLPKPPDPKVVWRSVSHWMIRSRCPQ